MDSIFVRPAPGARVRVPAHGFQVLPDAGAWIPDDQYAQRRLLDGDVVRADPPAPDTPAPAPAPAKASK